MERESRLAKRKDKLAKSLVVQALYELKKPVTFSKIVRYLSGSGLSKSRIGKALNNLSKSGEVYKLKKRYVISKNVETTTGIYKANPRGFGFILQEDEDIYIPFEGRGSALDGDVCRAVITRRDKRKKEGIIVEVIRRERSEIIGVIEKKKRAAFLVPVDKRINRTAIVKNSSSVKQDEVVVAEILKFPADANDVIYAEKKERMGFEGERGIQIEIIARIHGLPTGFPKRVIKEAEKVSVFPDKEAKKRKDCTRLFTVTIDGLDAKDFDDAVSCKREGNKFRLWVHIADVSYYVRPDSELSAEAEERAFSVYLVDRVIPLLPFELSAGICSLKPNQKRLAMTVEMVINKSGNVEYSKIYESVIESDYRLTYEEVDRCFEKNRFENKKIENLMYELLELSEILEKKRYKRGALNFEIPEAKVILDKNKTPVEIKIREKTKATTIIEEAMIVTNESVAEYLHEHNYPSIYRVHEKPDEENLRFVERFLAELGYPYEGITTGSPKAFQKVIDFVGKRDEKLLVNLLLLRAMSQARYSPNPIGHFGLSTVLYSHFTSPIRRYPDLIVHRLTKEAISSPQKVTKNAKKIEKKLPEITEHSSHRERQAETAERDSNELKLFEFMKREHLGDIFEGIISGVTSSGFFVELPNTAEGFISLADLHDDYYQVYQEKFEIVGRDTGKSYRVGERIMVRIENVNISERKMTLKLV